MLGVCGAVGPRCCGAAMLWGCGAVGAPPCAPPPLGKAEAPAPARKQALPAAGISLRDASRANINRGAGWVFLTHSVLFRGCHQPGAGSPRERRLPAARGCAAGPGAAALAPAGPGFSSGSGPAAFRARFRLAFFFPCLLVNLSVSSR